MNAEIKSKKQLLIFCVLGSASLSLGFFIYLIFRPEAYVSRFLYDISGIYIGYETPNFKFLKYYLGDYLWAFSLSCWLHTTLTSGLGGSFVCTLIVSLLGILYEGMQFFGGINGTGDALDFLLYLTAGFSVNIIYLITGGRK